MLVLQQCQIGNKVFQVRGQESQTILSLVSRGPTCVPSNWADVVHKGPGGSMHKSPSCHRRSHGITGAHMLVNCWSELSLGGGRNEVKPKVELTHELLLHPCGKGWTFRKYHDYLGWIMTVPPPSAPKPGRQNQNGMGSGHFHGYNMPCYDLN
jgi:hypothetical protein